MTYNIELNEEELIFLYDRCSRKAARLEEAHLEDIPCYRLAWHLMLKLAEVRDSKISKGENHNVCTRHD